MKNTDSGILVVARMATKMGGATLSYGVMTHPARSGATQFQISLVNSTQFFAALVFAVQGGLLTRGAARHF